MDEQKEITDKVWDLVRTAGYASRVPVANVQVIIDYLCSYTMPPSDVVWNLLERYHAIPGTSAAMPLVSHDSTGNIASSQSTLTNHLEVQINDTPHLDNVQSTSGMVVRVHSDVEQAVRETGVETGHDGTTTDSGFNDGLDVKQEIESVIPDNSLSRDIFESNYFSDISRQCVVKQEISESFIPENSLFGSVFESNASSDVSRQCVVKQEISESFIPENSLSEDIFESNAFSDISHQCVVKQEVSESVKLEAMSCDDDADVSCCLDVKQAAREYVKLEDIEWYDVIDSSDGLDVKQEFAKCHISEISLSGGLESDDVTHFDHHCDVEHEDSKSYNSENIVWRNVANDITVTINRHLDVVQDSKQMEETRSDSVFGSSVTEDCSGSLNCLMDLKNEPGNSIDSNQDFIADSQEHSIKIGLCHQLKDEECCLSDNSKEFVEMTYNHSYMDDGGRHKRCQCGRNMKSTSSFKDQLQSINLTLGTTLPNASIKLSRRNVEVGDNCLTRVESAQTCMSSTPSTRETERICTEKKPHKYSACCSGMFSRLHNLKTRKKIHTVTVKKTIKFATCPKTFSNPRDDKIHAIVIEKPKVLHAGKRSHKCSLCDKRFLRLCNLNKHKNKFHSKEKNYECNTCGKWFLRLCVLKKHKNIFHSKEKKYECNSCGKQYFRWGNLNTHNKKKHFGEITMQCSFCDKPFLHLGDLHAHERIHTGVKPYQCTTCGKSFSKSSNLNRHINVHTGVKPFKCTTCGKAFADLRNLKRHNKIHTGEREYKCTICCQTFSRSDELKNHENIHGAKKQNKCCTCKKAFSDPRALRKHKRIHLKGKL